MEKKKDTLYVNGEFLKDGSDFKTGYVSVRDGKIHEMGSMCELDFKGNDFEVIDLKGKFVYPGFTDSHLHLIAYSQEKLNEVDLSDTASREDIVEKTKKFIRERGIKPGEWVIGTGWNHENFSDKSLPDRQLLDGISDENPICIKRVCHHICSVNSLALSVAGIDEETESPEGGSLDVDSNGELTGVLRENAMDLITEILPSMEEASKLRELIARGCDEFVKKGLTTVHSDDFFFVEDKKMLWDVFRDMAENDELPLRVVLQLRASKVEDVKRYAEMGLKSWDRIGKLSVGPIKIIADGSLGSRTAALEEPYCDDKTCNGIMVTSQEKLDELVYESFINDFDVCAHAIGDRSINAVLGAFRKNYGLYKSKGLRPSIIHCQITSRSILDDFKELDVIANIQPLFLNSDWKIAESRIGRKRMEYSYCWKKFMDGGVMCAGSSDSPVEDFAPLYGIYAAVSRMDLEGSPAGGWFPEEKLDVSRAIDLFTKNEAYLSHEEDIKGVIKTGNYADFSVLSHNIFEVENEEIKEVEVIHTIVNGRMV